MITKTLLLIACLYCFTFTFSFAGEKSIEENSSIKKIIEYRDLQITEFVLKNGMRVVLKATDDDSEISIRLVAKGGYAALNHEERPSSELATSLVIESGIGDLCGDKLSAFLYDHSMDFNLKVEAFTRGMDACMPEESLEAFFFLVHKTFTTPKFNPEVFTTVLEKKKIELMHKGEEISQEDILSLVSLQEKSVLTHMRSQDLARARFHQSKQFFLAAFSNPEDFVCVIAGDLDVETVKRLAVQYFANIPVKNTEHKFIIPSYSQAPKTIAIKKQNLPHSQESLVRLALPLQITLDQPKLEQFEIVCQGVETRLRNIVKSHSHDAKGVDVWYELPLYPSLEHPWMTIQFHVGNDHITSTIHLVLEELRRLSKKGLAAEEIRLAAELKKQSLQLWEHDNDYWILLLSNYYLLGWDPQKIAEKYKNPTLLESKEIHATIRSSLLMDEYTIPK